MSEVLNNAMEIFKKNSKSSLEELNIEFDSLEKKARCCYFIGNVLLETRDNNSEIAPLFEEIFVDLFQSISSCLNGQYRLAYQSLRSSLELTVAAVYFYDHLIEFVQWKNDKWDFQFSLIKEILSESYAHALEVHSPPNDIKIRNQYRYLSQFVHGKYGFMTTLNEGPILQFDKDRSLEFIKSFEDVFACIMSLVSYRFSHLFTDVSKKYPFFRSLYREG
ncbi:hypothetical protein NSQ20_31410 [Paenibacillus sp. FSL K6-1122]|uniref:hypothetical protein n=1 Tax=Paenibacillus sp. FSL K6-1122 TaxID=2954512 RepID=UPI0030EF477B